MISQEDAEKALDYLKSTDTDAARARALKDYLDDTKKTVLADQYTRLMEGSAADRLKKSEGSMDYIQHLEKLREATLDYETLRNKRKSAEMQIEMWRSINSNMKKGNV